MPLTVDKARESRRQRGIDHLDDPCALTRARHSTPSSFTSVITAQIRIDTVALGCQAVDRDVEAVNGRVLAIGGLERAAANEPDCVGVGETAAPVSTGVVAGEPASRRSGRAATRSPDADADAAVAAVAVAVLMLVQARRRRLARERLAAVRTLDLVRRPTWTRVRRRPLVRRGRDVPNGRAK